MLSKKERIKLKQRIFISLLVCITLGLTPYTPEPHLVTRIRTIMEDPSCMELLQWFDFIMHLLPWMFFLYYTIKFSYSR